MNAPKVGALFAGYGGLELAVREVFPAASPAWVAEFDAAPSRILAQRFPDVPNLGDVTAVDWAAVEPVDIITGGSPCQDLSHAGKRAGMRAGTRSGLWASMCDAIETIRPRLVVWENVRGALSAEADSAVEPCPICVGDGGRVSLRALGRVLGDLAELGYDAAWCGLRAADVGAPHGRFRVFVLAWPADAEGARLEAWREGRSGAGAAGLGGRGADLTLLRTPTAQLAVNGGSQHPEKRRAGGHGPTLADEVEHLLPTPAVNDMGASYDVERWEAWTARMKAEHGNGNGHGNSLHIEALRMSERFGQYAPAIARWDAVLDRPAPAPTEPTGKGGAHRLSPRFVEWLMGLPAGWVTDTDTTRNEQLKALGNGVVPQQAAAAVRHLLGVRAAALKGVPA
jgi:DNA (cytosine-5)-methyltransferase 1